MSLGRRIKNGFASGVAAALVAAVSAGAPAQQFKRETRIGAAVADASQRVSQREALEQVRSIESPNDRITALERFVTANRGAAIEIEARELLMREYALRGEQRLREGNAQQAAADFKAAFRAAPSEMTDRVFSQYVFPLPMAMNAFGFRAESVELMKSFEPRFANNVNRLTQIGFFYVQLEAALEAVRVLERAVELEPQSSRTHNSLGNAYLVNLRLDEATAEFRRALELDPKDEYANLNLANMFRARGSLERAEDYYRRQLALKRDDAEAHGGLAITLLGLGRDEEAQQEIARATELAPDNHRFLTQLAYFYLSRRKTAPARTAIERGGRIEPRYAWAHIVKANIDAQEGKFGDALSTLLPAQNLGSFPTLSFEVIKALMSLDGYDQSIEVLSKSFTITDDGEFEALLGGVLKARSPRLDVLLERERQAALMMNDQMTTSLQYRLAEALARIDHYSQVAAAARNNRNKAKQTPRRPPVRGKAAQSKKPAPRATRSTGTEQQDQELKQTSRPRRSQDSVDPDAQLSAGADASLPGVTELLAAVDAFTSLDDGRQVFRMVWTARRLAESGVALDAAEQLVKRALAVAEQATEPDGSMRDAPLLDRQGRLAVFVGRAEDVLGWILLKKGDTRGAISHLTKSIDSYPENLERKGALWHLGSAMEEVGDEQRALDLYIAAFDPYSNTADAKRSRIEALYKRLKGSLDGLDQKLKQP